MHILFAHAGIHRVHRGSEIALEAVANEIAAAGQHEVTVVGSGNPILGRSYQYKQLPIIRRERFEGWPRVPFLRSEFMYEDLSFSACLVLSGIAKSADITVGCMYPYTSWAMRSARKGLRRPAHVFVTQNGDWAASRKGIEPSFFSYDGLICTNPVYYRRNKDDWPSVLIPNGIDQDRFSPGPGDRTALGLPLDCPIVLMVSALDEGKRIYSAIQAVSRLENTFLVIAGDGILRDEVDTLANKLLQGRYMRGIFAHERMPEVYRCADVFLHTTIGESFGNVYVEALSTGIPIVAHDEDITRWIMGSFASLVDTRSENAIVDAIERVLRNPPSQLNKGAAWASSRYGWTTIAGEYSRFLDDVYYRYRSVSQP